MNSLRDSDAALRFVPVIDLEPFRLGDAAARAAVAAEIGKACETSGFLIVRGHGVDDDTVVAMYDATASFFALTEQEKLRLAPSTSARNGYRPLRSSNLAKSLGQDAPADLCEFFSINRFEPGVDPNQWPGEPTVFEPAWKAYYRALEVLAATLMQAFALALDLPEHWFEDKIDRHCTALFANYYPAPESPPEPGQLRLGEHTDFGSLTIVYQDDGPGGLQVRDLSGRWLDIPPISGTFVVNIGDLMARWTNDLWVSTLHRVINPAHLEAGADRISLPFFHQPNEDAVISCIPTCTSSNRPPAYEPITSGEWREMKVARSRYS